MSLVPETITVNGKQEIIYRIDGHPITDLVIFDYTLTRVDRHRLELAASGELKGRNLTSIRLKGSTHTFEVDGVFLNILQARLSDLGQWGNEHFQYLFCSEAEYRAKRETGTGGNRPDSATDALLANKVDKVVGKGLSARDFTAAFEEKLENLVGSQFRGVFSTIAQLDDIASPVAGDYADVDSADGFVRCAYNATANEWVVPVAEAEFDPAVLETKVDKVVGKGLSTEDFTTAEKEKLSSLEGSHFRGLFSTYAELSTIVDPVAGDYADVDGGIGETVERHIWDVTDGDWYVVQGESTEMTGAQIKENYEAQPDTNALTDDLLIKLLNLRGSQFRGVFQSVTAMEAAIAAVAGDYAEVTSEGIFYYDSASTSWIGMPDISGVENTITAALLLKADATTVDDLTTLVGTKVDTIVFNPVVAEVALKATKDEVALKADVISVYTKTEIDAALTGKINTSEKGVANGVATLGANGIIPTSQLPAYVDAVLEYANRASFPVSGETGRIYVAIDDGKSYRWSGSDYVYITSGAVDSVNGKTGIVVIDKTDIGLGAVDNTSDLLKPVSTETQTALNLKIDKTALSNVNNTSDLQKPISTATQAALNLKIDKIDIVSVTGQSTTKVMSQKATTDAIAKIESVSKTSAYTVVAADKGKSIDTTSNVTIPASVFTVGDIIVVTNTISTDSTIIAAGGVTIRLAGSATTGTRTLAGYGVATLRMVSNNVWFASGAGLS